MTPERWQQIEALYHAARERGPGALAEAAPELRREVEALLAQETAQEGLLDRPAANLLDDFDIAMLGARTPGPHKIEAPIAPGGVPAGLAVMECPKCSRCYESPQSACPRDGTSLRRAFAGPRLVDGKYLVEQCLGRGGMGAVRWAANQRARSALWPDYRAEQPGLVQLRWLGHIVSMEDERAILRPVLIHLEPRA